MRALEFALLYALLGAGVAVFVLVRARAGERHPGEAMLALFFWPLYAPFLLHGSGGRSAGREDQAFLDALGRIHGTPLATLLPDGPAVRILSLRLRMAGERIVEIDRLLVQPDFSEAEARGRHEQFAARGDQRAAAAALSRVQNIQRLRALRDRFARELDEVRELLGQLRVQAEVVRLAGAPGAETKDLVTEILTRVEGLDAILADDLASAKEARS